MDYRATAQSIQVQPGNANQARRPGGLISDDIAPDTLVSLARLLTQQAQELNNRSMSVADCITGSRESPATNEKMCEPDCLLAQMRMASHLLGSALNEIERAQRSL